MSTWYRFWFPVLPKGREPRNRFRFSGPPGTARNRGTDKRGGA